MQTDLDAPKTSKKRGAAALLMGEAIFTRENSGACRNVRRRLQATLPLPVVFERATGSQRPLFVS